MLVRYPFPNRPNRTIEESIAMILACTISQKSTQIHRKIACQNFTWPSTLKLSSTLWFHISVFIAPKMNEHRHTLISIFLVPQQHESDLLNELYQCKSIGYKHTLMASDQNLVCESSRIRCIASMMT
jgi:hypothetical protein